MAVRGRDAAFPLPSLVEQIAAGARGVVMAMGKGGLCKITVAAAVAVSLAIRGHRAILTTTDPAAHVAGVLPNPPSNLTVTPAETAASLSTTTGFAPGILSSSGRNPRPGFGCTPTRSKNSPVTRATKMGISLPETVSGAPVGIITDDAEKTLFISR